MKPLVLFPSSSGAGTTAVLSKNVGDFVANTSNVLPVGQSYINLVGGKVLNTLNEADAAESELERRIVIPVGVTPKNLHKYTLYDMLGLGNWADCADLEVIKKAYHKAVLLYHPDKQSYYDDDGVEDRSVFLKIQQAYNTLCSEDKRRAYDSQLPFDENIPSDEFVAKALEKGPAKYLRVYDRVFKRNARFAVRKPVPEIGDVNTPIEEVLRFYEYWTNFESWRDFTGKGAEHDPDSAADRYQKREYQKENEKLAKRLKKKEMERIINLVTRAKMYDPRILQDKENRRLAKEAKLREKEEAKLAAAREKEKAEEAEQQAKEATKLSKAEREKQRKADSKVRNVFKKLLRQLADRCANVAGCTEKRVGEYGIFSLTDIEGVLVVNSSIPELSAFVEVMGGEEATKDSSIVAGMDDERALSVRDSIAKCIAICKNRKK